MIGFAWRVTAKNAKITFEAGFPFFLVAAEVVAGLAPLAPCKMAVVGVTRRCQRAPQVQERVDCVDITHRVGGLELHEYKVRW